MRSERRSSTSSSSFRRTARSITSYGVSGSDDATYGYEKGPEDRLHAQGLGSNWDIDHSSTAFFTACDGQGRLPGTDCKMDGWNHEKTTQPAPRNSPTRTCPARRSSRIGRSHSSTCLPMRCSPRTWTAASSRTSTSSRPTQAAPSTTPPERGDARAGRPTPFDAYGTALAWAEYSRVFHNPTIAGEADEAGLSWRFYTGTIDGDGGLWSSYQANGRSFAVPTGRPTSSIHPRSFSPTSATAKLADITWITPIFEDSDHAGLAGPGPPG